ncbi:MAG: hypothetical protein GY703_06615 [Gammaproteobacteria bacterium]|nr:hypothetical protein [Gammaproteobacteria bacterium]
MRLAGGCIGGKPGTERVAGHKLGGCCVESDDPDWRCLECGCEWAIDNGKAV